MGGAGANQSAVFVSRECVMGSFDGRHKVSRINLLGCLWG